MLRNNTTAMAANIGTFKIICSFSLLSTFPLVRVTKRELAMASNTLYRTQNLKGVLLEYTKLPRLFFTPHIP
jgi:hypothetical protein